MKCTRSSPLAWSVRELLSWRHRHRAAQTALDFPAAARPVAPDERCSSRRVALSSLEQWPSVLSSTYLLWPSICPNAPAPGVSHVHVILEAGHTAVAPQAADPDSLRCLPTGTIVTEPHKEVLEAHFAARAAAGRGRRLALFVALPGSQRAAQEVLEAGVRAGGAIPSSHPGRPQTPGRLPAGRMCGHRSTSARRWRRRPSPTSCRRRTSRPVAACRTFGPQHCAQELPQGVRRRLVGERLRRHGLAALPAQHAPTSAGAAQTAAAHSTSAAALLYTLPEPQKPDFDAMVEHLALALQHAVTSLVVDEEQAVPAQRASAAALL